MSTARIGGTAVGYDDEGSGDPLVLVHGHPFDRTMWRPQVERFSQAGWRVIAPDLRGYGETPVSGDKTPLETFARDVAGLLDHLGVGEVVLAGLSMGGQIAMEFHRLFPERLRGLVLADTSPRAETEEGRRARNEAADRLLREGMGPSAEELLPRMVAPRTIAELPEVAEHVMRMMRGTSPQGAAAALRGRAERPDYVEMLTRVAVPVLVVVGTEDDFTPVSEAELIRDQVPDATLAVVEGAGHMPNLERTAEFDAALDGFLARLQRVAA
ncbi:MAG TPA: alpha/beta fold hydrolase [Solirubrobacteraceae bacterium]|jgi:pimeloyl-ACP methyl ester carboxylesterase|nr:alpha/beta fold hydrolase [Solirubrobacteraceae bacterium]